MKKEEFADALMAQKDLIESIRRRAHQIHADVNQYYDGSRPYGYHLDMVANAVREHGAEACTRADDVAALMFGAYFHDTMEDARLTYNNVLREARAFLTDEQAVLAAEIVYALTNEKGRNRAERANDKYYAGIRATPYAPMVKLADRLANYTYSKRSADGANARMLSVYAAEMPHFLASISDPSAADPRLRLPASMLAELTSP